MRLPKEFVERKLSAALGARVTIDALNVSLLGGSLDITGVTVTTHGAIEPVLIVRRIKADVAMAAMLRKEVVIKSVVIEGSTVSIVRGADGATNLPKRDAKPTPAIVATQDETDDDTPSAWKLAAEKVQLLDGSVHYRDGAYHASAERIVGELLQKPDGVHVTVLAASLGRRDEALNLGEARAHVVFRASEIAKLPGAPLDGTFDVGDVLRGTLRSPSITSQRADVDVHAKLVLPLLSKLLPPALVPKLKLDGQADAHVVASVEAKDGLRIKSFTLTAADVTARSARGGASAVAP
ncbi:MAG: hypothetical protein M3478_09620 [Planctomycetota bacterium]|nr:hypothetical protein [Planctomycetota bacterium]